MKTKSKAVIASAMFALMLPGCSVMRTLGLAKPLRSGTEVAVAPTGITNLGFTEIGRSQIAAGNFGLAIETLQTALAKGEAPAPALNALGVAYARIGRNDLAATYFRSAMATDPRDERYAANLSQLFLNTGLARTMAPAGAPLLALAKPAPGDASVAAAPRAGQLVRVSRSESTIHVAWGTAGKVAPAPQTADNGFSGEPVVRVKFSKRHP